MKGDMAATNKMISSGFGSRTCSALHKMYFTVYGGQKLRVAMKFDMKGEMGIADKMMLQLIVNKAN